MATIFAAFGKFSQNNKGSIQNFGIIGVTVGAEELTKFIFFFCPCNYPMNQVYGTTFIWGPAIILLVVGYVVNRRTWRLMTGMCNRTQGIGRGGKRIIHFLFIFSKISMTAIIAPATWIVISFLKGDYYTCAAWPSPHDPTAAAAKFNLAPNTTIPLPCYYKEKPTYFSKTKVEEVIARDLRAYSHIIGWWFLSLTVLFGIFFVFVFRCMSKYSYEQSKYIEKYRDAETKLFEEALDAKAQAQAKIIVDQYFTKPRSKEEWDQIAVINDKVMKSKRGKPIYSPLHKFSNKELVALELAQDDIVTNSAQKKRHLLDIVRKKKAATGAAKGTSTRSVPAKETGPTKPVQPRPTAPAAATMMPMVAMAPTQRIRVTQPHPHPTTGANQPPTTSTNKPAVDDTKSGGTTSPASVDDSKKPNTPSQPTQQQPVDAEAVVTPTTQTGSRPASYHSGLGEDPIKEANVVDTNSVLIAEFDDTEDPILEANIAEQAEEIRRSMQNLDTVEDVVEEADVEHGEQAAFQDDDDSEPLL